MMRRLNGNSVSFFDIVVGRAVWVILISSVASITACFSMVAKDDSECQNGNGSRVHELTVKRLCISMFVAERSVSSAGREHEQNDGTVSDVCRVTIAITVNRRITSHRWNKLDALQVTS